MLFNITNNLSFTQMLLDIEDHDEVIIKRKYLVLRKF